MYNNKLFISSFLFASLVLFSACGGTSSSTENTSGSKSISKVNNNDPVEATIVNGVTLVDASSVGGIDYKCGTKEGTSNSLGVMDCQTSSISFSLGNLALGSVSRVHKDKIVYTPELLDQPRGAILYPDVSKVSMLLESLDKDGDISNGIVIDKSVLFITNQYFSTDTKLSKISLEEFTNIVREIVTKIHENDPTASVTFVNLKDAQDNLTARLATPLK